MQAYSVPPAEDIQVTAHNLVVLANLHQEAATAIFNGVQLVANPDPNNVEEQRIVREYLAKGDRRHADRELSDNATFYRSALAWRICQVESGSFVVWSDVPAHLQQMYLKKADKEALEHNVLFGEHP